MRRSVYLDTRIPSYLFDRRESLRFPCEVTRRWWSEESAHFNVFVSLETIAELNAGQYPEKDAVLRFVSELTVLQPANEIPAIVQAYIRNKVMPKDVPGDASHLAYASYYDMDFLLTWNCNHLANANKKRHVAAINAKLGLSTPEIITPLELFSERWRDAYGRPPAGEV